MADDLEDLRLDVPIPRECHGTPERSSVGVIGRCHGIGTDSRDARKCSSSSPSSGFGQGPLFPLIPSRSHPSVGQP